MKRILLTLTALGLACLLSSCSSAKDMTMTTSEPTSTATATATPNVTTILPNTTNSIDTMDGSGSMNGGNGMLPDATVIPESTGVTSMDKARRVIEQIEDELERLSEVDDAEVVIAGSKAAVALEFDDQYKGGIDDRLRGIVKERIGSIISGISTIAVTSDAAIMDAIESLGERLDTMADMTTLQSDLDAIIKKINGTNA